MGNGEEPSVYLQSYKTSLLCRAATLEKGEINPKTGTRGIKERGLRSAATIARVINRYRAPAVPTAACAVSKRQFHDATAGAGGRGW